MRPFSIKRFLDTAPLLRPKRTREAYNANSSLWIFVDFVQFFPDNCRIESCAIFLCDLSVHVTGNPWRLTRWSGCNKLRFLSVYWIVQKSFCVNNDLKRLAHTKGGAKNIRLNFQRQVFGAASLAFNNVVIREVRFAILLLPPKQTLLDTEKQRKRGG
jgi:hypothetical protein